MDAWRHLERLGCTHAVYELRREGTSTHYVAISQGGRVISTGVDPMEGVANTFALIGALRVLLRASRSVWTTPG